MTIEEQRIKNEKRRKWGPYLSKRQWGTVREDYSRNGDAWNYTPYETSRRKAYRWGEDGIGGISENTQSLCFSWAFWNMKDSHIKERLFGLTNQEGNQGEDVKELYHYLDASPSHSYLKMEYKYPHQEFPYDILKKENHERTRFDAEFELADTGIFKRDEYFQIIIEYSKSSEKIQPTKNITKEKIIQRRAFAGMIWSKQFYYCDVDKWLNGDPLQPPSFRSQPVFADRLRWLLNNKKKLANLVSRWGGKRFE